MPSPNSVSRLFAGLFLAAGSLFVHSPARASEPFPAALQEAAGMPCTPACVVCHGKTPGDISSFTARKLSRDLIASGGVPPAGAAGVPMVKANFATYSAKATTDPDVARVVAALKDGIDPETGDSLCGPTYGCGAHVAKKLPPSDVSAPLWALGAVIAGGILRRRRKANAG